MKKEHEQKPRPNRIVVMALAAIGLLLLSWRMEALSPGFTMYLFGVIGVTIVIYIGIRVYHHMTAKKCPQCGGALQDMGYKIVFSGAQSFDGARDFPSIAIRYLCCPHCEDICFQEFDYPVTRTQGDASSLHIHYKTIDPKFIKMYYGAELPKDVDFTGVPKMTEDAYQRLREKIQTEVRTHNEKLGFLERA